MLHARPFVANGSTYVIGHSGDILDSFGDRLVMIRSDDRGETWSEPAILSEGQPWHQAPCNVHYSRGRVYLVMERVMEVPVQGWPVAALAPILLSAPLGADLTRRDSWTFSNALSFQDAVAAAGVPHLIGVPFFAAGPTVPQAREDRKVMSPMGWLETNVVQFTGPDHIWHDPTGRTFHLWARSHTGSTNLACIAKAVESEDHRQITVSLEHAPSGEPMLYVPCPGGHMKFHVLYDEQMRLFWLLSTQSVDSMTRPDRLAAVRYGLPNNERHRLVLHFSRNCVDWCFAGLVASTSDPGQSRHYASMAIDGEDLYVLSRSGDARAKNAHDTNLITFHKVSRFRDLIY